MIKNRKTAPHETRLVKVWVDIDLDIADMVEQLQEIEGVRTTASCEGGISYGPYVMCTWTPDALLKLQENYLVRIAGDGWGYVHPKDADLSDWNYSLRCICNKGYEASLELDKVYDSILDLEASSYGQVRIIDQSGESYLFPRSMFEEVDDYDYLGQPLD